MPHASSSELSIACDDRWRGHFELSRSTCKRAEAARGTDVTAVILGSSSGLDACSPLPPLLLAALLRRAVAVGAHLRHVPVCSTTPNSSKRRCRGTWDRLRPALGLSRRGDGGCTPLVAADVISGTASTSSSLTNCSGIVSVMGKSTWQLTFLKVRPTAAKRLICSVRMDGAEVSWSSDRISANWGRLPLLAKAPMAVPLLAVPLGAPHADLAGAGTASATAGAAFAAAARAAALRVVGPALSVVGPLLSVGDAGASPPLLPPHPPPRPPKNGKAGEGRRGKGTAGSWRRGGELLSKLLRFRVLGFGLGLLLALASASSRSSRAFWHTSHS